MIPLFSYLILVGSILFIIYRYSKRNHNYWKKRNVPFVKPYPFLGNFDLNRRSEDVELERYKKYGRIYGIFEGNKPALIVGEPELLKDILIKDFQYFTTRRIFETGEPVIDNTLTLLKGETWKRIRKIVSPTFSTGKIKRVMSNFEDCAKILIQNFRVASENSNSIDISRFYRAFTMDVIASSAFSTKLDSHNDPENEFVKNAKAAFNQNFGLKSVLFLLAPNLVRLLGIKMFNTDNWRFFKKVTLEIIDERKRTGQTRNDFLQILMETAQEVSKEDKWEEKYKDTVENDSINHPIFKNTSTKHLSMDELVSQCVIFFLAGYHTTAITLELATYYIALNEEIQNKVFEEIRDVLEKSECKITYESIQKMKYLDNIISETLRIQSPAIWTNRTADADYQLGNTGITIPKGMHVRIPRYAMHRDPKLFPDPEIFNPDRFTQEEREKQVPFSYLPFGDGPRNCVGMRFALMELKVCLVYVLSSFKFKRCLQTKVPLEFEKGNSELLQPAAINLCVMPRSDNPLKNIL